MIRLLSRDEVAAVLTLPDCIAAVEQVFADYATGRLPKSASLGVAAGAGTFHVKAARANIFAAKINANFPANPASHGLPTIQGVIVVMDVDRGTPLGILDSTLITTLRTAAATAVAAKHLARKDATTVAVVGCGALAATTIEALRVVRAVNRVVLCDVSTVARERCARELVASERVDVVSADSLDTCVATADIIVTCTPATRPLIEVRHLRPGLFIAAVGADNPAKSEISPEVMAQALVVPDLTEQAAAMGDLHHAIAAGLLTAYDVHGELGDVISGGVPGRQTADQIFLFDSTGTALQDVVVASLAIERATSRDIGTTWLSRQAGATESC